MKNILKIDILSDLHIDFYIHQRDPNRIKPSMVVPVFKDMLDEDPAVEVLVVAGDVSHYCKQAFKVLEIIAEQFSYKKIFVVLGNHDLYRSSKHTSSDRFNDYMLYNHPVIEILEGNIVTFKGIRFGGCMGWYDKYAYTHKTLGLTKSIKDIDTRYKKHSNDYNYIDKPILNNLLEQQMKLIDNLYQNVDVMITHINPSINYYHQPEEYRNEETTSYYAFDGEYYLKEGSMTYWIYGHTHGRYSYTAYCVDIISNCMGYPSETARHIQIELNLDEYKGR